jgi:hypothetical protein
MSDRELPPPDARQIELEQSAFRRHPIFDLKLFRYVFVPLGGVATLVTIWLYDWTWQPALPALYLGLCLGLLVRRSN